MPGALFDGLLPGSSGEAQPRTRRDRPDDGPEGKRSQQPQDRSVDDRCTSRSLVGRGSIVARKEAPMKASRGAIQSKLEELLELQDKYTAAQIDHGKTRSELDARRVHATREARDDGLDDAVDWIVENVP